MTRPDVSIIVPAFNCESTISRAIQSALSQEGVSVDVVVCDDGSTDQTPSKVWPAPVGTTNPTHQLLLLRHDRNMGQCHALNSAAEEAVGRYIIELDADDYLAPGALAALVSALDHAPDHVGFAYGCVQYHDELNITHQPRPFKRADFYRSFPALYPFMYRREAWDAGCRYAPHLEKDGRALSIQDWDMALQLIEYMRYDGLALRDTLVLHYTYKAQGTVGSELKANNGELMAAFKRRWPKVTAEGL
jgi:glycosyltransferase involved in cell wall biosynthesis